MFPRSTRIAAAALAATALVACSEGPAMSDAPTAAQAAEFIGHDLPEGVRNVRTGGEAGMDRLVLVRFEIAAPAADAFARQVTGASPRAGADPGLGYLGEGLDWWPKTPPAGFAGAEGRSGNRTVKLLTAPGPGGLTSVWVAAFSM